MYCLSFLFHFFFTSTHTYLSTLLEANLIPSCLGLAHISIHPLEYNAILCIPNRGNHAYISSAPPLWLLTQYPRLTLHKTDIDLLLKFPWFLDTLQGVLRIHATRITRKEPRASFQIISIALERLS